MGHPNWKRLAELGQLPIEMQDKVTADIVDAQNNALKMKRETNAIEEVVVEGEKKAEVILTEEDRVMMLSKGEMIAILSEAKLNTTGNRKELVARIMSMPKEEVKVEEVKVGEKIEDAPQGEFIDELLK